MRNRPFLFSLPWALVLLATPEFLFNAYSLRLPPSANFGLALFGLSIAVVFVGAAAGLVFAILGVVRRVRPLMVHGIVAVVLCLAVMLYANSIPPKRYFAIDGSPDSRSE